MSSCRPSMACPCILLFLLVSCSPSIPSASACSCHCDESSYAFPSFTGASPDRLALLRDAAIGSNGALHLTPPDPAAGRNRSGAALLPAPVALWRLGSQSDVKEDASFQTSFTVSVALRPPPPLAEGEEERSGGEGLAFVIAPSLDGPPPGGFLGLNSITTSHSRSNFVAVDNHVALNIGSVVSSSIAPAPPSPLHNITVDVATAAKNYTVWVEYNGAARHVWVYVAADKDEEASRATRPAAAVLDSPLNLSDHVPQRAFVGFTFFTASSTTGGPGPAGSDLHAAVLSWNLTVSLPSDGKEMDWKVILPAVFGAISITVIMNVFVAAFYYNSRYRALKMELVLADALRRLPGAPREFRLAAMRRATGNFDEARKLGRGGFGAVYRGTLRSAGKGGVDGGGRTCVEVAVKKFIRDESRCYDDFLAEVDIINRLRHRNIVPLVGWCYEKGELLLIYEYMPNGSLDQHLFPKEDEPSDGRAVLGWATRLAIVTDVAAGLRYVHHESEHMVLHRDIKSSNILLDAGFHGRLGDFGLARVVGHPAGGGRTSSCCTDLGVAGTWGFIAPEYSLSHRATRRTDVYAFGVLVLEVVTGRRALTKLHGTFQLLPDWVWRLHREGRLLQAVDGRMMTGDEFDADGAARLLLLGLACTSPDPARRPTMAEAALVVAGSAPPPDVPLVRPMLVWPPEDRDGATMASRGEVDDDGFPSMEVEDPEDGSHYWGETSSSDALAASAIIRRKAAWAVSSG